MIRKIYLANLASGVTPERILDLFAEIGPVESVEIVPPQYPETNPGSCGAIVELPTNAVALEAIKQLNGFRMEGRRLWVTYVESVQFTRMTPQAKEVIGEVARMLEETDQKAVGRIRKIARFCGLEFVQALADEALSIQAAGGMMVLDGTRPRTLGGIFFYLARGNVSPDVRRAIYFGKKLKEPQQTQQEGQPHVPQSEERPSSPVLPEVVQQRLDGLRQALQDAEQHLEAVRGNAAKQAGVFSAIKAVLDLKKEIEALLREYPELV
jgi:RNA recognition motif-containing protein